MPYLEKSFQEVFKVINYPQPDVKKAAIDALTQFCLNFFKLGTPEATLNALGFIVPKLAELIRLDDDRSVVIQALDAYADLLEQLQYVVISRAGHKDAIMNCILEVMNCKDPILPQKCIKPTSLL